jgi:hypothetical protein
VHSRAALPQWIVRRLDSEYAPVDLTVTVLSSGYGLKSPGLHASAAAHTQAVDGDYVSSNEDVALLLTLITIGSGGAPSVIASTRQT